MSKVSRRDEVSRLLGSGLSYAEIGRRWGISRQRVWQIARKGSGSAPGPKLFLTTGEVAQRLGVPSNTVRYWADKGLLRSNRIGPRGDRRFRREDVDNFIKERG